MRYRASNSTSFRNVCVAAGLLVGSYVMAAFVNASPITQPKLSGPSAGRVIVVAPPADEAPAEAIASESSALHSL